MIVKNRFPTINIHKRIALIGEMPGMDEERTGLPFVGSSGRFFSAILSHRAGVSKDACFQGYILQHRAPDNHIGTFAWNGLQVQHGLEELRQDIDRFNPNIVVLLGNLALKAAKDPLRNHPLIPKAYSFKTSDWRGSIFVPDNPASPFVGRKCIAAYSPSYCLVDYSCTPLLEFDLLRAASNADTPNWHPRERQIIVPSSLEQAQYELQKIREARLLTGTDIEGYWNNLTSISFANDPLRAIVIPFVRCSGTRYWQAGEEPQIWRQIAALLEDINVPKVLQNGLYDRFALAYGNHIRVRNCAEDTMLKWWELYSELPKALDTQISVLIPDQPYYKGDRHTNDDATFFRYNGLDSCCTLEIAQRLETVSSRDMPACARLHYRLNNSLLNPMLYMELKGINYDALGAKLRQDVLRDKLYEGQARLNGLSGRYATSVLGIWNRAREIFAYAKATIASLDFEGIAQNTKKGSYKTLEDAQEASRRLANLVRNPNPTLATLGEIEDLVEISLNFSSNTQFIPYLYEELGLPVQTKKNKETGQITPTADYEALLRLSKHCQREDNKAAFAIIQLCIELRSLEVRQRMLGIHPDNDGRIRCGYNIVGSETGRVTCYTSPTGSGYNLQTIPNYTKPEDAPGGIPGDRDLFLADPGYYFFECDLSGADGWTYAAYAAMLGDPTMLDDYRAGVSPFDILTLMRRNVPGDYRDRVWLKSAKKQVKKADWDRFAMKRLQHGATYLEGGITISNNILRDSEGKVFIEPSECKNMRDGIFFARYPGIRRWHNWVSDRLRESASLTATSGQVRKFFGRTDDVLTQAVAFEPQANTTYVTNLAMFRLWNDPENRNSDGSLRIQPLHQVHDALCGQFRIEDTAWAVPRIRQYFNNEVVIAGQKIVIPFDGAYGISWGSKKVGVI